MDAAQCLGVYCSCLDAALCGGCGAVSLDTTAVDGVIHAADGTPVMVQQRVARCSGVCGGVYGCAYMAVACKACGGVYAVRWNVWCVVACKVCGGVYGCPMFQRQQPRLQSA